MVPLKRAQAGQVLIEYLLMLFIALSVLVALDQGLRLVYTRFQMYMTCQVAAPCPGCSAPSEIKTEANRRAGKMVCP